MANIFVNIPTVGDAVVGRLPGIALAVSIPMLAGIVKEFHDRNEDGDFFDPYDLMADFIGVVVGLVPALFIFLN